MNKIINFCKDHSTNIIATLYVFGVQIPKLVLATIQVWIPKKDWPTQASKKLDKVVASLMNYGKKTI